MPSAVPTREKRWRENVSRTTRLGVVGLCVLTPTTGSPRPVMGQSAPRVSANPVQPTIRFGWEDPHRLFVSGQDGVARELERLAGRLGVTAVLMEGVGRLPGVVNLKVVLIRHPHRSPRSGKRALGAFIGDRPIVGNEWPTSTITIFLSNVLRAMGYPAAEIRRPLYFMHLGLGRPKQRDRTARAVARVIFHETIHALAPGLEHTDTGLMRETFTREDLVQSEVEIHTEVRAAFRNGISGALRTQAAASLLASGVREK